MTNYKAINMVDVYKVDHRRMYPDNTEFVFSNLTARGSRIPEIDKVVVFGIQAALQNLVRLYDDTFFSKDVDHVCEEYERRINGILGPNEVGSQHIRDLHALGYLPIEVRCLDEGTECPLRVPMLTIVNTDKKFYWITNYLETILSAETWKPITNATIALNFRRLLDRWAIKTTGSTAGVDFQGHDFSMRGLCGFGPSGAAHLLSFGGTDVIPCLDFIEDHYFPSHDTFLGGSVPATEHSVMCCGSKQGEQETFERLLALYPSGILSVVSDTWDLWNVLTGTLPTLKEKILSRDGKLVIRPDSGNPCDIVCGEDTPEGVAYAGAPPPCDYGVISLLDNTFGSTENSEGYKELDSHIGAIYGDAITYDRANEICERLAAKGFASTNIVLGIGSFTYQYNTRDTFGMAIKATWCQIDGVGHEIFKDPITDDGLKKSAKGLLAVVERDGQLVLNDQLTIDAFNGLNTLDLN